MVSEEIKFEVFMFASTYVETAIISDIRSVVDSYSHAGMFDSIVTTTRMYMFNYNKARDWCYRKLTEAFN